MAKRKSGASSTLGKKQQYQQYAKFPDPTAEIASALGRIATVMEARLAKEYPVHIQKTAEIHRPDDERKKQIGDKADPGWFNETEKAVPSRFQRRFDEQAKK